WSAKGKAPAGNRGSAPRRREGAGSTQEQIRFGFPEPGLLVQVQPVLELMLGWLVVTVNLVAVPVVLQTTPPEPVKPGSVVHAPEAYVLLSTKYASWAVAALRGA